MKDHFKVKKIPVLFRCSRHINVRVDSSKFYKLCTFQISPLKPSFTIFSDKGLPEEMIKLANEKTQQIKEAYELVKKSRQ